MKTPIAVALIQMGALLLILPVITEAWTQHELLAFVSKSGVTNLHVEGALSKNAQVSFLLMGSMTGIGMIATATLWSLFGKNQDPESLPPNS